MTTCERKRSGATDADEGRFLRNEGWDTRHPVTVTTSATVIRIRVIDRGMRFFISLGLTSQPTGPRTRGSVGLLVEMRVFCRSI
jgi:hypothetical protein